jgi:hypothetical protein
MKTLLLRSVLLVALVMLSSSLSYSQTGWWKFDNPANLTAAEPGYGNDLELTGTQTAIAGPVSGNGAVTIPQGSYYKMTHGIAPNGGGTKVNRYSLMFDFKVSNLGIWHTFYQADSAVTDDDGDYFKNTSGMLGRWAIGYSTSPVAVDTWYRLVITSDIPTSFKSYLNGTLLQDHTPPAIDDRQSLLSYVFLFGDNDGDDGDIDIAEVAIWDYPLSESEVLALGGAGAPLPVELTSFSAVQSNGNVILNWETATEINNSGFAVERKGQNESWKSIGFIAGYGTSADQHSYSFVDKISNSGKYSYRLKQIDFNGSFSYSKEVEVTVTPSEFKLYNNYPNPFNPSTIISYNLPSDAAVNLKVYNSLGELVTELFNGHQAAGYYEHQFNAYINGRSLASGIYIAELKANEKVQRIKMMLSK